MLTFPAAYLYPAMLVVPVLFSIDGVVAVTPAGGSAYIAVILGGGRLPFESPRRLLPLGGRYLRGGDHHGDFHFCNLVEEQAVTSVWTDLPRHRKSIFIDTSYTGGDTTPNLRKVCSCG